MHHRLMALACVELETLVSKPDALTTRPLFVSFRKTLYAVIPTGGVAAMWIRA